MAPRRTKSFLLLACLLFVLALPLTVGAACTLTTWASFCKQARGDLSWDLELNGNFDKMDRFLNGTSESLIRMKAYAVGSLPAAGTIGRMVILSDGGALGALVIDDGTNWTCTTAKAQKIFVVTCPPYNATGDGSTNDRAALSAADTAATSTGTLVLPKGTYKISSNLTLNAALSFANGAVLAPDASVVVTILGDVQAGSTRIFSVGSGTISFAANRKVHRLNAKWWGTTASNATTTVSCTSGLTTITTSAAQDFQNGDAVYLFKCGINGRILTSVITAGGGTTSLTILDAASSSSGSGSMGHDDSYPIAAAVAASNTMTYLGIQGLAGTTVTIEPGEYPICGKPVQITATGTTLTGAGRALTALNLLANPMCPNQTLWLAVTAGDPNYLSENPFTGTALLTGTGSAMQLIGKVDRYVQISDCPYCGDLNGLAQFTAEATVNLTSLAATSMIMSSSGTRDSVDGDRRLFDMKVATNGTLTCRLNVAGSLQTVTSSAGAVTTGLTTHLALTYDGINVRCFVNGTQVGSSVPASGTITQTKNEQVRLGPDTRYFPEGSGITAGFTGRLDAPRISNTARYTSGFTAPTAKWGLADSSTIVQCNFDNQTGIWTMCHSGLSTYAGIATPGPAWIPFHKTETCGGGPKFTLSQMQIAGGGVLIIGGPTLTVDEVHINTTVQNGLGLIQASQCGYDARFRNIRLDAGTGTRVMLASHTGLTTIENLNIGAAGNAPHPVFLPVNSTFRGQNFISGSGSNQVFPVIIRGEGAVTSEGNKPFLQIDGFNSDVEASMGSLKALILLDDIEQAVITGSQFGCFGNATCYALQIQKGGNLLIQGSALAAGNAAAQIHVAGSPNPTGKVMIVGSQSSGSKPPRWVDVDGLEVVQSSRLVTSAATFAPNDAVMVDFNTMGQATQIPNAGSLGTFRTTLTKLTGTGTAVATTAGDTSGVIGIVGGGPGTSGRAQVQVAGQALCTFDGGTTANDYVQISTIQAGACRDAGAAVPGSGQVIGRILSTASALTAPVAGHGNTCVSSGGTIPDGTYQVSNTWVTITGGETTTSNRWVATCSGGGASSMTTIYPTEIPNGTVPTGAAGWRLYISAAGGIAGSETLQPIANYCASADRISLSDATQACSTGNFTVTTVAVGTALPGTNTAGPAVSVLLSLTSPGPLSLTNSSAYAAVTNTATETYFAIAGDGKIGVSLLALPKRRLEISLAGVYSTNGAGDTITLRIKLCQVSGCASGTIVTLAATAAFTAGAAVTNRGWSAGLACNVFTAGTSGTLDCQGLPGGTFFTAAATGISEELINTGTVTINTSVDEYASASAQWNNASANNTMTLRNFAAKVY